jgi:hypothetical protein
MAIVGLAATIALLGVCTVAAAWLAYRLWRGNAK